MAISACCRSSRLMSALVAIVGPPNVSHKPMIAAIAPAIDPKLMSHFLIIASASSIPEPPQQLYSRQVTKYTTEKQRGSTLILALPNRGRARPPFAQSAAACYLMVRLTQSLSSHLSNIVFMMGVFWWYFAGVVSHHRHPSSYDTLPILNSPPM